MPSNNENWEIAQKPTYEESIAFMGVLENAMWVGNRIAGRRLERVVTETIATDAEGRKSVLSVEGSYVEHADQPHSLSVISITPSERLNPYAADEIIGDWIVREDARQANNDNISNKEIEKLTQARATRSTLIKLGEEAMIYRGYKNLFQVELASSSGPNSLVFDTVRYLSEIKEVVMMASGVDVVPCSDTTSATTEVRAGAFVRDDFVDSMAKMGAKERFVIRRVDLISVGWNLYRFGLLKYHSPAYPNAPLRVDGCEELFPRFKLTGIERTVINPEN